MDGTNGFFIDMTNDDMLIVDNFMYNDVITSLDDMT